MNREKPPENPPIATLTDGAVEKVREALQGGNCEGIRMTVSRRGGDFVYKFDFVDKGKADPRDFNLPCGDYRFFIDWQSEDIIKGSVIDYVHAGFTQAWVIDNPNPAWDSEMAREVARILDEVINPGVGEHGGHINLVNLKDNMVYVEMSGGCQGCGMAAKTLKHGVMKILTEKFPQITNLIDVTDHSAGTNPFFNNEKGSIPTFKS